MIWFSALLYGVLYASLLSCLALRAFAVYVAVCRWAVCCAGAGRHACCMYAQALRVSRQALTYIPVQPAVYSPPPPPPHPSTTPTLATLVLFLLLLAARWVAPLLGGRILCSYPVKAVIPFLPDDLLGGMFGKALRSAGRLGGKGVLSRHGTHVLTPIGVTWGASC